MKNSVWRRLRRHKTENVGKNKVNFGKNGDWLLDFGDWPPAAPVFFTFSKNEKNSAEDNYFQFLCILIILAEEIRRQKDGREFNYF